MKFNYEGSKESNGNAPKVDVDYKALNNHVIEVVDCEEPQVVNGVVAGIVDLGMQEQPDAQYSLQDDEIGKTIPELNKMFAEQLADGSITKFEEAWNNDKKAKEIMKFVPQKPRHSIDMFIDFPDIMVDKGQFFGAEKSEPKPYRISLGGQFWQKSKGEKGLMLLQKMMALKVTNIGVPNGDLVWSLNPKSIIHRMAVDGGLIKAGEKFLPEQITDLLGKTFQFQIQVWNKPNKKTGQTYFTENIKYIGKLPRGGKPFENYPAFLTQLNPLPTKDENGNEVEGKNDPEALKQIRAVQLNQMQQSPAFADSVIAKELADRVNARNAPKAVQTEKAPVVDKTVDLDDDLPF